MITSPSQPATLFAESIADGELRSAVADALWAEPTLRGGHSAIEVGVEHGVIMLRGHVLGATVRAQAVAIARRVPGVTSVANHLVGDNQLEIDIAQALAHDTRTCRDNIRVYVHQGVVDLHGPVSSPAVRRAAAEVAAGVPYVRAVVDHMKLTDAPPEPVEPRLLEPQVGQPVTATDMPLGQVVQVIVSPHDRRVTGMVVQGRFPDLLQVEPSMYPDDMPKLERRVLIPIESVHNVGEAGVMLNLDGIDAARYPTYDALHYIAPAGEPDVPFPYHAGDVLIERG